MVQDTQGINPLLTRHQQCRARHPLTGKGAPKPHLSTNASGPTRTPGLLSRPDGVAGMRLSLGATECTEAEGMTPTTIAARLRSLWVPRLQ